MHILDRVLRGETPKPDYVTWLKLPPLLESEPGRVSMDWQVDPKLLTPWGAVFGGYLAALAARASSVQLLAS